ncbi:PH domain-containing protein [Thermomonospora catenispora]|uniref:PH domain-containing protein n=1 Tax=Thermomonospora catenispora TaxID=2493090 RepID=UPI00111F02DA|nr:PH domain-containing protein [Thermomonospora catenispora]TNY35712.1 PH domain-containing protein [Thermomonospora catenispora]
MSVTNSQETPPPVRRAAPGAIALAAVTVAGLTALNAWWASIMPPLLVYSLPPLAVTALALVHTLRYRVVIDEGGIRIRGLTGEKSIPWPNVIGVQAAAGTEGTVVVDLRDGSSLVLRELPVPPGGTDALVAEMRRRAGLSEQRPESRWYAGRPSRRPLAWAFPMLAVSTALVLVTFYGVIEGYGAATVFGIGLAGVCYHVRLILLLLYGRTEAGPNGLYNRSALAVKRLDWKQVKRLEVVRSPFGHRIIAVPHMGANVALAAPRTGLAARGPAFDDAFDTLLTTAPRAPECKRRAQPRLWYPALVVLFVLALLGLEDPRKEPWWPTRHEAASLPDPCAVVDPAAVRRMVPDARPPDRADHTSLGYEELTCRWHQTAFSIGLEIEIRRYFRNGGVGATEAAERRMSVLRDQSTETVTGLGDEAFRRNDDGHVPRLREIWARRANVIVHIKLEAKDPADVDAPARRALESIELR